MNQAKIFHERAAQYDDRAATSENADARHSYARLAVGCRQIAERLERLEEVAEPLRCAG